MSSAADALPGLPHVTEHLTIRQVPGEGIIVLERTAVPFPESDVARDEVFAEFVAVLRELPRADLDMIIDSRRSRGRNDAAFERIQHKYRRDIFTAFRSASVVLASVVGRMQVERYEREGGATDYGHFSDVDEAIDALRRSRGEGGIESAG